MLVIRLKRIGRKNDPSFRIVVTEKSRGPKSGNYLEKVGFYNPQNDTIELNKERIEHWLSVGAQPSDTVHNLLVSADIIQGKKINVLPQKSPVVKEEEEKDEAPQEIEEGSEEALKEAPAEAVEESVEEVPETSEETEESQEETPQEEESEEKEEESTEE